jgi:hypothetical protein
MSEQAAWTNKERRKIATLDRRARWLEARNGGDRDDAESAAIRWALATLDAARLPVTPDVEELDALETSDRWHLILAADPLLPDCSGTHMMGYAYCQRLALVAAPSSGRAAERNEAAG